MGRVPLLAAAALAAVLTSPTVTTAAPIAPSTLVRESFVDYPREHPGALARPPDAGGAPTCRLPASDLCTDFKDGRYRWATLPVSYYINTTGGPPRAAAAIKDGFAAWENEVKSDAVTAVYGSGDLSAITYRYDGPSAAVGASLDEHNVVSFADLTWCSGCLAVTTYWYWRGTSTLAEFDMTFNTAYPWSTTTRAGTYDVQNVTTHEAGHTLVLGDLYKSSDSQLTMYGYAGEGETSKDTLGAGDVLGVRTAYPLP